MANEVCFALLLVLPLVMVAKAQNDVEFTFNGFSGRESNFSLDRVSIIKPSGLLRLTNRTKNGIGHAFYNRSIRMKNTSSIAYSFSTTFVFAIVHPKSVQGGHGFAFAIAPTTKFPRAAAGHYLGLLNKSTNGNSSNNLFAVEFDTVNGFNGEGVDSRGNHVGINVNNMDSSTLEPAKYYTTVEGNNTKEEELSLDGDQPIQAWIDYDGVTNIINVTVAPMNKTKPEKPLITRELNLTEVIKENMYIGFSAATGATKEETSAHYIMGWSFSMNGKSAPELNLSSLPMPPSEKDSPPFQASTIALIVSLCVVTVLLLGVLLFLTIYRRAMGRETLEDWELECPHRFRYQDLYAATKGFKENHIIGVGGFGTVYKAVLPTNGNEVAVKKITRNSIQGMREFAAEIESLGRLRHKHLVNLQGWCKRKNDLLLVYDYIPNGSLDSLLFSPKDGNILSWKHRFNIVKGIAAGLLYLHEEWEQVVIHRDVKSSNVLIDADMNGRLGDFGLARLYDHGTMSHTTNVVGTIGYIAPELARTGKASESSDVYAYGVLLLEVATGRRPTNLDGFILADWVMEQQQLGKLLESADEKLKLFVLEEMELVLKLGLLCSHQLEDCRPTMRQVMRYLNGDDKLRDDIDWKTVESRHQSKLSKKLMQSIYDGYTSTSYHSSSISGMSTTSIDAGR